MKIINKYVWGNMNAKTVLLSIGTILGYISIAAGIIMTFFILEAVFFG